MDYKFFKDDKQVSEVILPSWVMSFFMRERILNKDNYVFRIGAFYNGNNISDLVNSIEKFLKLDNRKRQEMGYLGRVKIKKEFSRNKVVSTYLDSIKGLIHR